MNDFNEQFMCEPKPASMRTVAEILAIAESSYYRSPANGMCTALVFMAAHGIITKEERIAAMADIEIYLHVELDTCHAYLDYALRKARLPHNEAACRAIYKDWDNRPRPSK